jgi:hypothetical protein
VACKGVLQFKSKGKTEAPLFSAFYIDVDEENQKLTVLTIDTFFQQIKQDTSIKAKVLEAGVIEITDKLSFDKIFKSMDVEKEIEVWNDHDAIYLQTIDGSDWYKRRLTGDKALDDVFEKKDLLFNWRDAHTYEEVEREDGRKVKIALFTTSKGSAFYPMRIKVQKKDMMKLVADSINLTKDNDTVILSEDGTITISTGRPNSTNMAKHKIPYEDLGREVFEFAIKFSALQAITPNLLDDVILNFRKQKNETIVLRIESMDKTMVQVFSIGSQDKDGILYDIDIVEEEFNNEKEEVKE